MIETIAAVSLPVDEKLEIRKNRILPEAGTAQEKRKRISIVTGIHGDRRASCRERVYVLV